jgi:hypothetical protein
MRDAKTTFNISLRRIRDDEKQCLLKEEMQHYLNARVITYKSLFDSPLEYLLRTPKNVRQYGMKALVGAFHSNVEKNNARVLRGQIPILFTVKYRTKATQMKMPHDSVKVKQTDQGTLLKFFGKKYGNVEAYTSEAIPDAWTLRDFDVVFQKGSFWACIPFDRKIPKKQSAFLASRMDSVALDPGCRTFLNGYSPDGAVLQIGDKAEAPVDVEAGVDQE